MQDAIEQFRMAIQHAGLLPPEVIEADGRLHRFASNGMRGDDAGWYVFHGDGIPAGAFGDWRTGASKNWRADIGRMLQPQEEAAYRARVEAIGHERESEKASRRAQARAVGERIWQAHRTHYYQRLVQMGVGHRRTALLAYALMAVAGTAAVLALPLGFSLQCVIITMCVFLHLVLGYRIDTAWRRHRIGAQTP
ncbi:hypothetical protein [Zoogloea sp.]|uniref:hypothetical protein n=1 Tax=Zoogloea sp. TaxID=49181 RepID=UPI001AC6ECF8|nr:hypothetical protein [Zoogloea sp.]MBN8285062.1 hypothetical protein [Zoogloea sp.]